MRFSGFARIDRATRRDGVWPTALVTMALGMFGVFVLLPASPAIQLAVAATIATAALTLAWRLTPRAAKNLPTCPATADERGAFVDGALLVAARDITNASATTHGDRTVTIDARRGRRHTLVFDRVEDADAFVDALGLDASRRATKYKVLPPWSRHLRPLGLFLTTSPWILINILRFLPGYVIALVVGLYGLLALPLLLPQRVEVGHDGVLFSWLKKRRFLSYSEIKEVRTTAYGVVLDLEGGRTAEIRITQREGGEMRKVAEIAENIQSGLERHGNHVRADEESLLARRARSVDAWVRDMRALGTAEAGSYRTLSIPRERLWEVLENPTADPSAREGAALALHASLDDAERGRLAGVAARSAAPRLRIALEAIVDSEDDQRVRVAIENAEELDDQAPLSCRSKTTT